MNLNGQTCYLIGPMDRAPDQGVTWRKKVGSFLNTLGVAIFDPTNKPIDNDEMDRTFREDLLARESYVEFARIMKEIREIDLRMVDHSTFIFCYLNMAHSPWGTAEEFVVANLQKKPIVVVVEGGKNKAPWWLFAQIPHEYIFSSFEEAFDYLKNGKQDKRWKLFQIETKIRS